MQLNLERSSKKIANFMLLISSLFALYTSGFGFLSAMAQRSIHWLLIVIPIFMMYPAKGKNGKIAWYDAILAIVAIFATLYVTLTWKGMRFALLIPPFLILLYPLLDYLLCWKRRGDL
jgi:TRAP-type uncharacterized transport system fused permease subunit